MTKSERRELKRMANNGGIDVPVPVQTGTTSPEGPNGIDASLALDGSPITSDPKLDAFQDAFPEGIPEQLAASGQVSEVSLVELFDVGTVETKVSRRSLVPCASWNGKQGPALYDAVKNTLSTWDEIAYGTDKRLIRGIAFKLSAKAVQGIAHATPSTPYSLPIGSTKGRITFDLVPDSLRCAECALLHGERGARNNPADAPAQYAIAFPQVHLVYFEELGEGKLYAFSDSCMNGYRDGRGTFRNGVRLDLKRAGVHFTY